jgi:hypothetical protein
MTTSPSRPDEGSEDDVLSRFRAALRHERALEEEVIRAREVTRQILVEAHDAIRAHDADSPSVSWSDLSDVAGVAKDALLRRAKSSDSNEARVAAARERQLNVEMGKLVGQHDPLTVTDAAALVGVARLTMHRWLAAGTKGYTRDADGRVLPPAQGWPSVPAQGKVIAADQPVIVREAAKRLGMKRVEVLAMVDRGQLTLNDVGLVLPPAGGWPVGQNSSGSSVTQQTT